MRLGKEGQTMSEKHWETNGDLVTQGGGEEGSMEPYTAPNEVGDFIPDFSPFPDILVAVLCSRLLLGKTHLKTFPPDEARSCRPC